VLQGTFSQPDRAHEKAGTGTEGTGKQGEPMGDANRQGMGEGGVATMTPQPQQPRIMTVEEWKREALIHDFLLLAVVFFAGAVVATIIPIIFHISPIYVDCGCGAQASMARQCFESGNLSSWQCGIFK